MGSTIINSLFLMQLNHNLLLIKIVLKIAHIIVGTLAAIVGSALALKAIGKMTMDELHCCPECKDDREAVEIETSNSVLHRLTKFVCEKASEWFSSS